MVTYTTLFAETVRLATYGSTLETWEIEYWPRAHDARHKNGANDDATE